MTLESLARTIAKARHGTDAMWANYMPSARAVVREFEALAYKYDAEHFEPAARMAADLAALIARPDGAKEGNPARKFGLGVKR